MSSSVEMNPPWLCAAAMYCFGVGTGDHLMERSVDWLPGGPDLDALFQLANEAGKKTARWDDVYGWIGDVIYSTTGTHLTADDFRWIAIRCASDTPSSIDSAENVARIFARAGILHPEEAELFSGFMAYVDDLDDGLDPSLILPQIVEELDRQRGQIARQFVAQFESQAGKDWVVHLWRRSKQTGGDDSINVPTGPTSS